MNDPLRHTSVLLVLVFFVVGDLAAQDTPKEKIAALEARLKAQAGEFDWGIHNELRHLYGGFDESKSLYHCDVILQHKPMDGYILEILSGREVDTKRASGRLMETAAKYPKYRFLAAACWLKAAEVLGDDKAKSAELLRKIGKLEGEGLATYRALAAGRLQGLERPAGGAPNKAPWTIPVLVINYFPLTADKQNIDIKVTSNVGGPVKQIEEKCRRQTLEAVEALEQGSRFRPYSNPQAQPSLKYKIVDTITYYEPVPHHPRKKDYADYNQIMERVRIREWVEAKGVREVWIWGYHSKEIAPVESNMASVHGNVSNSQRDSADLPMLKHTYTVYHYNYERETDMAVHNHLHQIEVIMRKHGGELWQLFEGKPGAWRCGNCHFPVNGKKDYDYENKEYVDSDIEDWKPEGFGKKQRINCDRWASDDLKWYIYWMQAIPGAKNGLDYKGRPLANWWEWLGDYDQAVMRASKLTD